MARLPVGVWSLYDDLQPLQPMVQAGGVGGCFLCSFRLFRCGGHHQRRQHVDQGAPLGVGRKRGEFAQAIGRSRGGRTTKVHALTDDIGRPVALCLTPGQAHDLTGVAMLLERIPTPRRLLADRAYDARRLRDWLAERGC